MKVHVITGISWDHSGLMQELHDMAPNRKKTKADAERSQRAHAESSSETASALSSQQTADSTQ